MKRIVLMVVALSVAGFLGGCAGSATRRESGATEAEGGAAGARAVRGRTPYLPVENEPPAKLIVDEPLADGLAIGVALIQYRTENCRLVPVFGKEALKLSPRVGHLHVRVDDLPWVWADSSDNNTVDIGGMPPGEHKVTIELVDATHKGYPGQSKTVKFTVPKSASAPH